MGMNLYIVSVDLINGLYPIVLDVLSLIAIFSGVLVITTKNPIVSVLFLISLFLVIAVYLLMVGMHYIGLSYLLVYVGAIAILFLFILMLINVRVSELLSYTGNSLPLGLIFSAAIYNIISRYMSADWSTINSSGLTSDTIDLCTSYKWDGALVNSSHIASIGNVMYTSHSLWLIVVGFILLLAMVGAIALTLARPDTKGEGLVNKPLYANLSRSKKPF